jgi:CDP-glucose 4,6-dehydratase
VTTVDSDPIVTSQALTNRTVLITGHTGFKGSWLSLWLAESGVRVIGYALEPPTDPSLFEVAGVAGSIAEHHIGDIRDRDRFEGVLRKTRPDVVLHLAARTIVRESYREPAEAVSVNVLGTSLVLDAIRAVARPCAVVVVSSDKCYHNDGSGRPLREDDRLGGDDPYSASKGAMEVMVSSYRSSFFPPASLDRHGIAIASARAGNVIGGGDWTEDGLIADVARAVERGEPVGLRNPTAVRPWQHVLEPLSGYVTLAEKLLPHGAAAFCEGWNFGPRPEDDATVRDVVEAFIAERGSGSWIDSSRPDQPHEASVLRLAIDKARTQLGWQPRWRLPEAIVRTASWYRRFAQDSRSARESTLDDIAAFGRPTL